ncbi:HAD family hydrolase [Halocatena salina]|uniref:HAD hydrolase family protein n=1 Tax=Halocatena salina TaxID=2934340 RepID=A0A8U0A0Y4_9EURY|nr:HAD hydrolase family protein [Halocatena salina]UPM42459.1 HAD hydrolase family protein [Halocatena salina]
MNRYNSLYRLYDEFDTATLREYQTLVDLFPALGSRVALELWQEISDELDQNRRAIRRAFPAGETFADIAAHASRDEAFTALDLNTKYGQAVNVLVLDVDETLRSAGRTDNEIPRETLYLLTQLQEEGIPVVICTGQTLENVKGFITQGLGNETVHSGRLSVVYEAGNGVFTPGYGEDTKTLLYEGLDEEIRAVFDGVRSGALSDAPEPIKRGCHLQGNEFNITLKPNFQTGSDRAVSVIDDALCHLLDLLAETVDSVDEKMTRAYYAARDPEIRGVLERHGGVPEVDPSTLPETAESIFERIDIAYYKGDAAEMGSLELDKPAGVRTAFDVLGLDDPFALVMGDSKSDLRVMEWVEANDCGIAAAPDHASRVVSEHVLSTDELVFERNDSASMLRIVYALNRIAGID